MTRAGAAGVPPACRKVKSGRCAMATRYRGRRVRSGRPLPKLPLPDRMRQPTSASLMTPTTRFRGCAHICRRGSIPKMRPPKPEGRERRRPASAATARMRFSLEPGRTAMRRPPLMRQPPLLHQPLRRHRPTCRRTRLRLNSSRAGAKGTAEYAMRWWSNRGSTGRGGLHLPYGASEEEGQPGRRLKSEERAASLSVARPP